MVEENIIHILKTLESEGYIAVASDYGNIIEVLREFDLERILTDNFNEESY